MSENIKYIEVLKFGVGSLFVLKAAKSCCNTGRPG